MTAIEDMDDRHLINAYCVLERDPADVRNAVKPVMKAELEKRGLIYTPPHEKPLEGEDADWIDDESWRAHE